MPAIIYKLEFVGKNHMKNYDNFSCIFEITNQLLDQWQLMKSE